MIVTDHEDLSVRNRPKRLATKRSNLEMHGWQS